MSFDCLLAQDEGSRDFTIALGERHQAENLYLAPGETCKGASGESMYSLRGRPVAGQSVGHRLVERHGTPIPPGDRSCTVTQSACGNLQPALNSLTVRWKHRRAEFLAQRSRGFSQTDGPPGLHHRQRTCKSFDAKRRRQVVSGLPSETEALRKRCTRPPSVALG